MKQIRGDGGYTLEMFKLSLAVTQMKLVHQ